jgi:hypothetical protein
MDDTTQQVIIVGIAVLGLMGGAKVAYDWWLIGRRSCRGQPKVEFDATAQLQLETIYDISLHRTPRRLDDIEAVGEDSNQRLARADATGRPMMYFNGPFIEEKLKGQTADITGKMQSPFATTPHLVPRYASDDDYDGRRTRWRRDAPPVSKKATKKATKKKAAKKARGRRRHGRGHHQSSSSSTSESPSESPLSSSLLSSSSASESPDHSP